MRFLATPLLFLFLFLLLLAPLPAAAQAIPGLPAPQPQPSEPPPDLDALVRVLQDDEARAALIQRLTAPPEAAPEPAGFASRLADVTRDAAARAATLAESARTIAANAADTLAALAAADLTAAWPTLRELAAVIAATFAVFALLRWAIIRLARRLRTRPASHRWPRRLLALAAVAIADTAAVFLAAIAGYGVALAIGTAGEVEFYKALFLNAFVLIELGKALLRALLGPDLGPQRPLPLRDEAAAYTYFWTSRIASLLGYVFLFLAPLVLYTVSWTAAEAIRLLAMLAASAIAITLVVRNRTPVCEALTARLRNGKSDLLARIAAYLSHVWHVAAIAYVLAVLVIWIANPYTALPFMLRATAQSLLAGVLGMIALALLSATISRGVRVPARLRDRLPLLQARLNAVIPTLLRIARFVVVLAVLLAVAQAWRLLDAPALLATAAGQALLSTLATVALVVLVGLAFYLALASWVEYRLNPNFGSVPTPRERTLLALLRNAATIALAVVVGMVLLSELGVNIAPLLAGAGVVGLAIGFGAQRLVQDIITGIFIQFENAMNEGEVVTAAGISGLVEKLTIRSVSIRDLNGVVHVIPFSAVDRVSNMMRYFSCHLVEIGVAYDSDIPKVKAAMLEAFDRLRETEHGAHILEPMEMYGLARFAESSMIMMGRFKTLPGRHWNAGRAYNEILKGVFDAHGITIPFPQRTVRVTADQPAMAETILASAAGR
jgi:small conductance mechanosensitive channel